MKWKISKEGLPINNHIGKTIVFQLYNNSYSEIEWFGTEDHVLFFKQSCYRWLDESPSLSSGVEDDLKELDKYLDALAQQVDKDAGNLWIQFTDKFRAFKKTLAGSSWQSKQGKEAPENDMTVQDFYSGFNLDFMSEEEKQTIYTATELFAKGKMRQRKEQWVRPKIVCLCGSTRFAEWFMIKRWELEKQSVITLGINILPDNYFAEGNSHGAEQEGVKDILDELHKRKIDLSDEVFVLNVDGYIGESTRSEIEYAEKIGKPVKYLEPLPEPPTGPKQ